MYGNISKSKTIQDIQKYIDLVFQWFMIEFYLRVICQYRRL